jgi:hypothetical protein
MPAKDPKEIFLMLLSDVRQNTERAAKIYRGRSCPIEGWESWIYASSSSVSSP